MPNQISVQFLWKATPPRRSSIIFQRPLEKEQSVSRTEHPTPATRIVPLLRRSTKMVIRWDSDKQQYTAQRPLLPVTQRITVPLVTFGGPKKRRRSLCTVCLASETNTFLGQVVERSEHSAHTGKLGATVIHSSKLSSTIPDMNQSGSL